MKCPKCDVSGWVDTSPIWRGWHHCRACKEWFHPRQTKDMEIREMNAKTRVADRFAKDNKSLIEAGSKMAEAALRVIHDYDGFHRLMLSVSEWTKAIANEGGRAETYSPTKEPNNDTQRN